MATFVLKPNYSVPVTEKPRFLEAKYGDGYAQVAPDGLNTQPQIWSLRFNKCSYATFTTFRSFMQARWASGSVSTSFDWLAPRPIGDGVTLAKFRCKDWDYVYNEEESIDITATFEQVFE